jgi:tetratricopeptide (TPR) repeat protein
MSRRIFVCLERCFVGLRPLGHTSSRALSVSSAQPPAPPRGTQTPSAPSAHEVEKHISVLQQETREHLQCNDFGSALTSALACLETCDVHFGRSHAATACALNNVGQVHRQSGELAKALPYLEDAVEVYRGVCGAEHGSTGQALSNLGLLHAALAQRSKGVERMEHVEASQGLLERALECRRKAFGEGHPQVGIAMYQLATAARLQKKFSTAETLLQGAVGVLRAAEGPGGLATATALNNLGLLRKEMGQFPAAMEAYREALETRTQKLGQRHPDALTSLHNLAECTRASGDEEGALKMQRDILAIMERGKGPE